MNRKLIAIDLDGTLLNSSLDVSSFTISIIKKLKEQGHVVVLASGRPYRSMKDLYDKLGLGSPLICYNGALVFNPKDSTFSKLERRFPSSSLRKIYKENSDILLSSMAEDGERIYLEKEEPYLNNYFPYINEEYLIGKMNEIIKEDCFTSLFACNDGNVSKLKESLEKEGFIFRHWNGNNYSEAVLPNVNKGVALTYIMKQLSFKKEDCLAFGDSDNDFEMLSVVKDGYVLKNSISSLLKDTFKMTRKGNDQDGVAYELANIFGLF